MSAKETGVRRDGTGLWRQAITQQAGSEEPVSKRPPIPRQRTTSTGKPIPKGQAWAGPRDFCPEG